MYIKVTVPIDALFSSLRLCRCLSLRCRSRLRAMRMRILCVMEPCLIGVCEASSKGYGAVHRRTEEIEYRQVMVTSYYE